MGTVTGIDAGYFINKDLVGYGRFESSKLGIGLFGVDFYKSDIKTFAVYGKKFFGNSFYTNIGLAVRTVHLETLDSLESTGAPGVPENPPSSTVKYTQEYTDIPLIVAIGNQWQWDYFTLGCDWIGYTTPALSRSVKKNDVTYYNVLTEAEQPADDVPTKDPEKSGSLRLLTLYLGVSF